MVLEGDAQLYAQGTQNVQAHPHVAMCHESSGKPGDDQVFHTSTHYS